MRSTAFVFRHTGYLLSIEPMVDNRRINIFGPAYFDYFGLSNVAGLPTDSNGRIDGLDFGKVEVSSAGQTDRK